MDRLFPSVLRSAQRTSAGGVPSGSGGGSGGGGAEGSGGAKLKFGPPLLPRLSGID
jgi:hypothetical protein